MSLLFGFVERTLQLMLGDGANGNDWGAYACFRDMQEDDCEVVALEDVFCIAIGQVGLRVGEVLDLIDLLDEEFVFGPGETAPEVGLIAGVVNAILDRRSCVSQGGPMMIRLRPNVRQSTSVPRTHLQRPSPPP